MPTPPRSALGAPDVEADTLATLAVVHSGGEVPVEVVDARLLQALTRARESTDVLTELRASVNLSWSRYSRGDVVAALEVLEASCDRAAAAGLRWSPLSVELRVLRRVVRYVAGRWAENPDGDADLAPDAAAARLAAAGLYVQVGRGDSGAEAAVQRLVGMRGLDLQVQLGVDGCLAELRRWQGRPEEAADVARAATDDLARCFGTDQMGVIWLGAVEVAALADVAEEAALRDDDAVVAALRARAAARVAALEAAYGPPAAVPSPPAAVPPAAVPPAAVPPVAGSLAAVPTAAAPGGTDRPGPEAVAWLARGRAELSRFPRPADGDPDGDPDHGTDHGTDDGPDDRTDDRTDEHAAWRAALAGFGYGYPFEEARCRLGLAASLLRTSRRGDDGWAEAEDLLARAAATADVLGARPLAASVAALARRAGVALAADRVDGVPVAPAAVAALTAREQDVLRLVARGWTNRRVGSELFISEKTVSVHLSNVMAKLRCLRPDRRGVPGPPGRPAPAAALSLALRRRGRNALLQWAPCPSTSPASCRRRRCCCRA